MFYPPMSCFHAVDGVVGALTAFAQLAPAHFRRTQPPIEPYPVSHIVWKQVGTSEWHAYAGKFELYTNILWRWTGIVEDPKLSDEPINAQKAGVV